jgi:hypothetical protein
MADQRRYLLDANVFIQASRQYYGFDTCPGFWLALIRQNQNGCIFSIDRVKAEIVKGNDKLKSWILSKVPETFFKKTDSQMVVDWFRKIIIWVENESQYKQEAKAEFASVADGWLVAYAKANGMIVVTHEEYAPDAKGRVPIPNVCRKFHVEYINVFEMLSKLGIQFVLRKHK